MFDFTQYPRLSDKKAVEQTITRIAKRSQSQRIDLHLALVGSLDHATGTGNGDTTLVTKCYNAVGNETNKAKGIAIWLKTFTNLKYSKAKDGSEQWLKPKGEALIVRVGYDATPFWDMPEVEKANKPFDFDALLESLLKRAMQQIEKKTLKGKQANHAATIYDTWIKVKSGEKAKDSTEVPFEEAQQPA